MRILCVLLPHFPLQCEMWRHREIAGRTVVILQPKDTGSSQKIVLDFSPELDGLQSGVTLQQVLSRYGEATLLDADLPYYRLVFNGILEALESKSPLVEGAEPGLAYVGLDGLQGLYPDDNFLVNAVKEAIPEAFVVRIGMAESKFLAYLAAMYSLSGNFRILSGGVSDFLKDLSCDVLPVSVESKEKLHEFGIYKLCQIVALSPGPLQSQFGTEGKRIWDLARGYDDTPLYPRLMEESIEESATLSSVTVSMEAVLSVIELLLLRVFTKDVLKGKGIRSLDLWTKSWGADHWEKSIRFKEPAMDVRSAVSRIKQFLENFPQPGPVEQLGIKLTGLSYGVGRQRSIFAELREHDHLLEDIKQLELRLDGPQVFRIKEVEPWSKVPERRYALIRLSQ
jgi:DNA polymerase-4